MILILTERPGAEEGEEFKPIRRGWCLGEEKFREELLTQMNERMGAEHYGELAGGDGDDGGVDRQASGDGHARGYLNHLLYRRRKLGGE